MIRLSLGGTKMFISFIIPVYNEAKRVHKAIIGLEKYLQKADFDYEVLFIDDGSQDQTAAKIQNLSPKFHFRIVSYRPNRGKGYAVRTGMLESRGDYRLFLDVDMSTPIEAFEDFRPHLDPKTVLIGSRKGEGSKVTKHQPFIREKMGQVFTLLARFFIASEVTDFTCGFKCFPKSAAVKIFPKTKIERWSYDAEILFLAKAYGFKIREVPVTWTDDQGTRVVLLKDSIQSFLDLMKIRWLSFRGVYKS